MTSTYGVKLKGTNRFKRTTRKKEKRRARRYKNNCTSNDNDNGIDTTVRCRLCATCKPGYKRTGSKTKCQECPNIHANRGFIALGVFIMFIGSR